jgi:hypothetical protein
MIGIQVPLVAFLVYPWFLISFGIKNLGECPLSKCNEFLFLFLLYTLHYTNEKLFKIRKYQFG